MPPPNTPPSEPDIPSTSAPTSRPPQLDVSVSHPQMNEAVPHPRLLNAQAQAIQDRPPTPFAPFSPPPESHPTNPPVTAIDYTPEGHPADWLSRQRESWEAEDDNLRENLRFLRSPLADTVLSAPIPSGAAHPGGTSRNERATGTQTRHQRRRGGSSAQAQEQGQATAISVADARRARMLRQLDSLQRPLLNAENAGTPSDAERNAAREARATRAARAIADAGIAVPEGVFARTLTRSERPQSTASTAGVVGEPRREGRGMPNNDEAAEGTASASRDRMMRVLARLRRFDGEGRPTTLQERTVRQRIETDVRRAEADGPQYQVPTPRLNASEAWFEDWTSTLTDLREINTRVVRAVQLADAGDADASVEADDLLREREGIENRLDQLYRMEHGPNASNGYLPDDGDMDSWEAQRRVASIAPSPLDDEARDIIEREEREQRRRRHEEQGGDAALQRELDAQIERVQASQRGDDRLRRTREAWHSRTRTIRERRNVHGDEPQEGGPSDLQGVVDELRRENPFMAPEMIDVMARNRIDQERVVVAGVELDMTDPLNQRLQRARRDREARYREIQLANGMPLGPIRNVNGPEVPSSSSIMRGLQQAEREVNQLEARLDATQRRLESTERRAEQRTESLRSTAIMQNASSRTGSGSNAGTTERMLRYVRDREHIGEREPVIGSSTNDITSYARWETATDTDSDTVMIDAPPTLGAEYPAARVYNTEQGLDGYRREYLSGLPASRHAHNKAPNVLVSPFLENAVTYLDRIRQAATYDEALTAAMETGFANKEFFADKHDDFLMDISKHPAPHRSSWLQPGAKFSGSQHTTYKSATGRSVYRPYSENRTSNIDATRPLAGQYPRNMTISDARTRSATNPLEQWPVKVTLHSVDFESMTLTGTMEAYDVPQHGDPRQTSPDKKSPITTYLEGQIIDLQTHSFLTPSTKKKSHRHRVWTTATDTTPAPFSAQMSFPATTPSIDAANWRHLPPFADIKDDDEVARIMLSKGRMAEVNEGYIFMRWKERCFIHSHSDTCPQSPQARRASLAAGTSNTTTPSTTTAQGRRAEQTETRRRATRGTSNWVAEAARFVSDPEFGQPIQRFPRPNGAQQTRESDTRRRLEDTPAPPRGSPGPGPSIVAHIPSAAMSTTILQAGGDAAEITVVGGEQSAAGAGAARAGTGRSARRAAAREAVAEGGARTSAWMSSTAGHRASRLHRAAASTGPGDTTTAPSGQEASATTRRHATTMAIGEGDDTDTGHGLTISGFYYASLDRLTGKLVGLYFDPSTSPYQCLRLEGEMGGARGAWSFT